MIKACRSYFRGTARGGSGDGCGGWTLKGNAMLSLVEDKEHEKRGNTLQQLGGGGREQS